MTAAIDNLHATKPDVVADETPVARVAPVTAHVNTLGRYDLHRQPPPTGRLRPLRRAYEDGDPAVLSPLLGVSGDRHQALDFAPMMALPLIAQTIETDHDLVKLLDAVGAEEHCLVRLQVQPPTLVKRMIDRERAGWSGLPGLVEHAQDLAVSMPALRGVDLVLSTDGQHPEAVAQRIRAARPEQFLNPAPPQR
jgi:hypothetical protein